MNNIVIVGAGFAGLRVALKLEKRLKNLQSSSAKASADKEEWRIILIDKNSYHTFTPALYEAATAYNSEHVDENQIFEGLVGGAVSLSIPDIIKGKNIHFVQGEVTGIDFASNVLQTKGGDLIPFNYIIMALGGETSHFGVKGAEKRCYNTKTIEDVIKIRRRIGDIFSSKKENINIVVVGGGFSGVEVSAEIATYTKHLARNKKIVSTREIPRRGKEPRINISIMEAGDKIVSQAHPALRKLIEKRLGKLGVNIRVGKKITETMPGCVIMGSNERCDADIIVWSGGIKGPSLFKNIENFKLNKRGMIPVDKFMRVNDLNYVFAVGDNASFIDENGDEAPMTAFIAEQQADIAADNVISAIRGQNMKSYRIYIPGYATSVGGRYAVDRIFGLTFSGFIGWLVKKLIDLRYFLSILPIRKALSLWFREVGLFTKND